MILLPASVLVVTLAFFVQPGNLLSPLITTYGYTCSGLMSAGIVLACIQKEGWIKRIFSWKWLGSIGTISYGLYILHGFLMGSFRHHLGTFQRHGVGWLMPLVAFATTFALASLSYRILELPFLRLKDRLAPTRNVSVTGRDATAPQREEFA